MTKLRKNLKIGDIVEISQGIRKGEAGYSEVLSITRILKTGDHIEGYGTIEADGYWGEGTRVLKFETADGRAEHCSGVLIAGQNYPNLRINPEN